MARNTITPVTGGRPLQWNPPAATPKPDRLSTFPNEVLTRILRHLSIPDLLNVHLVSPRWRDVTKETVRILSHHSYNQSLVSQSLVPEEGREECATVLRGCLSQLRSTLYSTDTKSPRETTPANLIVPAYIVKCTSDHIISEIPKQNKNLLTKANALYIDAKCELLSSLDLEHITHLVVTDDFSGAYRDNYHLLMNKFCNLSSVIFVDFNAQYYFNSNRTPLISCCIHGLTPLLPFAIQYGIKHGYSIYDFSKLGSIGELSALGFAVRLLRTECVKYLLKTGIDVNAKAQQYTNNTALDLVLSDESVVKSNLNRVANIPPETLVEISRYQLVSKEDALIWLRDKLRRTEEIKTLLQEAGAISSEKLSLQGLEGQRNEGVVEDVAL